MTTVTDTDVLNRVGNTPLVHLYSLSHDNVEYFAKLEGHNPFGSVKDRASYYMMVIINYSPPTHNLTIMRKYPHLCCCISIPFL